MASFDSAYSPRDRSLSRRALLVGGTGAEALRRRLAESGYETAAATAGTLTRVVADFAPDVTLIVLEKNVDAESEEVAVARHLREEPATHALPLILVYVEEERLMRSAALNMGVDDCFGIWTPHGQILARLDALFWRIEAGRRAAFMSGDKRLEIDNFMVLLEAVREDIRDSANGTLALIYAMAWNDAGVDFDKQGRDRTLAEAYGFFRLNLRRMDSVGFYGPTMLLIYLPRLNAAVARTTLMTLREQFLLERAESDLAIGVASFPDDSSDVETLIESAEVDAGNARAAAVTKRKSVSQVQQETGQPVHQVTPLPLMPQHTAPVTASSGLVDTIQPRAAAVEERESTVVHETRSNDDAGAATYHPVGSSTKGDSEKDIARAAADLAAARERERRKRGSVLPRRLLLTVSDAARMAQLNALVRSAGYEARTAFDGQQALDLLRIESPDVLLLDYELRGIDGLEMLRRLHKQTNGKLTVPVVMLLAPMKAMVRREALELGASGIVAMPYDPAELLDSVRLAGGSMD